MKKSIFAVAMAAALAAAPMTAFAEEETEAASEADELVLDYNRIDESVYEGTWISTGLGFDLYLPSDWNVIDPATVEGAEDEGLVFMAQEPEDSNGDGVLWTVDVTVSDPGQFTDIDDLYTQASAEETWENVIYVDANGIPAIGFDIPDKKVSGLGFVTDKGAFATFQFVPNDDDDFNAYLANMLNSVSPTEEDAETTTE